MHYILTKHAQESINERHIRLEWVDVAFCQPQLIEPDRVDSTLEHRMARIDEYGGRVLRLIVNTTKTPPRIVTVFFDRGMRNKI